jgi:hypothetical protein
MVVSRLGRFVRLLNPDQRAVVVPEEFSALKRVAIVS